MAYRFRKTESTYLVWMETLNRYLQLKEPAFRVLRQLKEDWSRLDMIAECAQRYELPAGEAKRFIGEIEEQFQILYQDYLKPRDPVLPLNTCPYPFPAALERCIAVHDRIIRFSFGDPTIEEFIFPLFAHLEIQAKSRVYDMHLEIFMHKDYLYLVKDQKHASRWTKPDAQKLKGALLLDITTIIHQTSKENWMGVIHASSVSKGKGAVMFPAQPGAGKSTLAALLMAHGCELVSDDFTPMAIDNQHIYSFPGAISVKEGSISLLRSYIPQLDNAPKTFSQSKGKEITFLAPNQPIPGEDGYKVNAIVFVQYDKQTDCMMERVNNLDVINDFLTESWLAHHSRAAEKFMEWYLETPCYRLRYGNHQKAIESIQKLFG